MKLGPLLFLLAPLAACSQSAQPPPATDASVDVSAQDVEDPIEPVPDDRDAHAGLLCPRCESVEPAGPIALAPVPSTLVGTLQPVTARRASPGTLNPSTEQGELAYRGMGMGVWRRGPGEPRRARMDLGGTAARGVRRSLLYFAHVTDFQLVDDESPIRMARYDGPQAGSGALRPGEAYVPRIMSAFNRRLAELSAQRRLDFTLITGDCADNAQRNELRWVTQVMDGARQVRTDSGSLDDLIPGMDNDPKDPFDATACPSPWYFVPGNHDLEVVGVTLPDADSRAAALGTVAVGGTRDYRRWYAPIVTGRGLLPDPERALLLRSDVGPLMLNSPSAPGPVGHGLSRGMDVSLGIHYTFNPVQGVPVRVIALDTSDPTGGSHGLVRRAVLDRFLVPELQRAARDRVLVILASHHPTTTIDRGEGLLGGDLPDAVPARELETLVASYPNVIAWMVGHEHANRVRAVRGSDASHPGYWEVETNALADWPNQMRLVELLDNGDGTVSLDLTMVDYEPRTCMERRFRQLSLVDYQSAWSELLAGTPMDRNLELVHTLPAEYGTVLAAARGVSRIESETTLAGR